MLKNLVLAKFENAILHSDEPRLPSWSRRVSEEHVIRVRFLVSAQRKSHDIHISSGGTPDFIHHVGFFAT